MSCLFHGFNFVRNFFIPSVTRRAFGKQKEEKIYLPRLFVVFAALTFNAVPSGASPPTHYVSERNGHFHNEFSGLTPDLVAQESVADLNSLLAADVPRRHVAITGSCRVVVIGQDLGVYLCPYRFFEPTGQYTDYAHNIYTRCGPQYQALWNGTEFYCPPAPDCDGPAQ